MPIWSKILFEFTEEEKKSGLLAADIIRKKYLGQLAAHTGRNTILYASKWTQPSLIALNPDFISMTAGDIQGLMEVVNGLSGNDLDLILHSPGGSPEATESFVSYLRTRFGHIRVIIPHAAMSAATMLACAADQIVMGKHSFIGPIDPQLVLNTASGLRAIPAQDIVTQLDMIEDICKKDPKLLPIYYPMIQQYGPALIMQCIQAQQLSEELVCKWLTMFMFKGAGDLEQRKAKSKIVAKKLSNHDYFKSHGRFIDRIAARKQFELEILDLETDQIMQDLVLSVFHATTITFTHRNAVKIIENQNGNAFVQSLQIMPMMPQNMTAPPQPPGHP